jgi:hypothetical protein
VNQLPRSSGDVPTQPCKVASWASRLVLSIAVLLPASGSAQTAWGPAQWNFPGWNNGSTMFTPLQVFPRPNHPLDQGLPNNTCPLMRATGLCMFVDDMGTADPNDDREYYAQCRSDGVLLVDITVDKTPVPATVIANSVPAADGAQFLPEPPLPTTPQYPPSPVLLTLQGQTQILAGNPPQLVTIPPYCPTNPNYAYDSRNTPGREATVYRAGSGSQHPFYLCDHHTAASPTACCSVSTTMGPSPSPDPRMAVSSTSATLAA